MVGVTMMLYMFVASLMLSQPHILLISAVIGITNFIPYVGPLLGLGFGVLLYLGLGLPINSVYSLALGAGLVQILDNVVFAPVVLSYNVDLHPLTVVLVLVIGGQLLGVIGLLIAVPVAASIKIVAQEFYRNYQLQVQ